MISIFARHTYLLDDDMGGVYLQRVSARIRGEEISQYLEGKLNPKEGFEKDVCIYVKPMHLDHIKDGSYVDVLDDEHAFEMLKDRQGINVIAMAEAQYEYFKTQLKNKIFLIPHHHINFEEAVRSRKEIINCGVVGPNSSRPHVNINNHVKEELAKIGFNFTPLLNFLVRKDVTDYYKTIDIQIIGYFNYREDSPWKHPTKIINAASFGIPTIVEPSMSYKEIEGFYIPVNNMESLLKEAEKLRDKKYYSQWSAKVRKEAEKYHISKIAKLYKRLV